MEKKKGIKGRPDSLDAKRNVKAQVRFTKSEHEQILHDVEKLGVTKSHYFRNKILTNKKLVVNGVSLLASLDQVGGELGRSGNNINQLAKHANLMNKHGKIDETIFNRFNVILEDYIRIQSDLALAIRKIIREVQG